MFPYSGNAYAGRAGDKGQDQFNKLRNIGRSQTLSPIDQFASMRLDLNQALLTLTLKDEPAEKEVDEATQLLKAYLMLNEGAGFKRVMQLRHAGWHSNKEQGDAFFKQQREKADKATTDDEQHFFKMMIEIAEEMNLATRALAPAAASQRVIKVMDICSAPGGYSAATLNLHKNAQIYGISLPAKDGGHEMILPRNRFSRFIDADVTMFAADFLKGTNRVLPANHPEPFQSQRPFVSHQMDIVFCDGIVLRGHQRASYRKQTEADRLMAAQLILTMQRIIQGGTVIMLLHKIDSWRSTNVLYTFSRFAELEVFKPHRKHSTRSSFYMIAKGVDVKSFQAQAAVAEWKTVWYDATFGGEDGRGVKKPEPEECFVMEVLQNFGPKLIELGRPVWKTQADALAKTSYAGNAVV